MYVSSNFIKLTVYIIYLIYLVYLNIYNYVVCKPLPNHMSYVICLFNFTAFKYACVRMHCICKYMCMWRNLNSVFMDLCSLFCLITGNKAVKDTILF